MATFGERLKELRTKSGYTQVELSNLLGITISSIAMYETNKRRPGLETLESIADFFNCDLEYLLGRSDIENAYADKLNPLFSKVGARKIEKKKIPIIGDIACGTPIYADEHFEGYTDIDSSINADYAIVARGNSMSPTVNDGDLILVDSQSFVDNNQIAVVVIDDSATLKRVRRQTDSILLIPDNHDYEIMVVTGEKLETLHIIGRAVAFQRKL